MYYMNTLLCRWCADLYMSVFYLWLGEGWSFGEGSSGPPWACVTNTQAEGIKRLYSDLMEYDKKPLTFQPHQLKPSKGRFARRKSTGYVSIEAVKR